MTFKDKAGTAWNPEINVVTIGRVRKALEINLLELVLPNSTLAERLDDPCLLVDVLYVLCEEQTAERNLTDEAFGKLMTPDSIHDGWLAVLDGVVNFSPRGLRPAYQKVLEKTRKLSETQTAAMEAAVQTPEFDAMLDRAMQSLTSHPSPPTLSQTESTGDASSLPESSESSPAATPSQP